MTRQKTAGLGELLRYLAEQVDQGAEARYASLGINYRPRYTPVMRALAAGASTVTEIVAHGHHTQGAVSQTVKLMTQAGLVERYALPDGRKSGLRLTTAGAELLEVLEPQWETTFRAIGELEKEIGHPLLAVLQAAVRALDQRNFSARLEAATDSASTIQSETAHA